MPTIIGNTETLQDLVKTIHHGELYFDLDGTAYVWDRSQHQFTNLFNRIRHHPISPKKPPPLTQIRSNHFAPTATIRIIATVKSFRRPPVRRVQPAPSRSSLNTSACTMIRSRILWMVAIPLVAAVLFADCGSKKSKTESGPESPAEKSTSRDSAKNDLNAAPPVPPGTLTRPALGWYDFEHVGEFVVLPPELNEISGLAMTDDGRLFTHNDENSEVSQVDFKTGKVVKHFFLGGINLHKDFEGIAIVGKRFFLVKSNGDLYEFAEGNDGATVPIKVYETNLSKNNDIEGLCYDPKTDCLLLACKESPGKKLGEAKAIYAFSLKTMSLVEEPRFVLPLEKLAEASKGGRFNPSGIEYNPTSGTFLIVAAEGKSLVEVSPDGEIIGEARLNGKQHKQAEGITFGPDNMLLISDEARGEQPTITRYVVKPK